MNLPGVHGSKSSIEGSSKATIPAKKPVRQQPQGLKMRFRPIGFGSAAAGQIGSDSTPVEEISNENSDEEMEDAPPTFRKPIPSESSGADESSESSTSEDESSSSDVEMAEVVILPPKGNTKVQDSQDSSKNESSQASNGSLKRKHSGREGQKPKNSSSRSLSVDGRELKRLKTKQNDSQKSSEDRASVSIKSHKSASQPLSTSPDITSAKKNTPILPPPSVIPRSMPTPRKAQVLAEENDSRSSVKASSKKHRSGLLIGERSNDLSPKDLTRATDPSLTGDERKWKKKKEKKVEM